MFFLWVLCIPMVERCPSLLSWTPSVSPSLPPPAVMALPFPVSLSGESDDRPQEKGWVLRIRRSNRAQRQDQDESFICFYLAFQAWIVGVLAGGQGNQEGTIETWGGWGTGGEEGSSEQAGSWDTQLELRGLVDHHRACLRAPSMNNTRGQVCGGTKAVPVWTSWQPAETGVETGSVEEWTWA